MADNQEPDSNPESNPPKLEAEKRQPEPEPQRIREAHQSEPIAHKTGPEAHKTANSPPPSDRSAGVPPAVTSASRAHPSASQEQPAQFKQSPPVLPAEPVVKSQAVAPAAPPQVRADYEHPFAIRITHWINAVCVFVLVTSGLRIFRAFPSFGPKIPEHDLIDIPKAITLGGWLGGALQWHFTFMWFFAASGAFYLSYQLLSGHYRTVLFTPKDIPGVWPMVRHYFLFGPKPPVTGQYNPLQKLAYTSTVGFGILSLLTGLVMYKPAQFSWLAFLFGGFHLTRIWHFASMCGFVAFIPGHLIMVALHGWSNFYSMLAGWKREPEYQD
jgi:Ni/Fe-hydrogenase b-type cytochrome subunit